MTEFNMPIREQNSNKGTFGKVLNVSGSNNYIGSAYLSTAAILKVGAGFAALASDNKIINSVSKLLPEAVYMSRSQALRQFGKFTVMLIGCGLGQDWCARGDFKDFIWEASEQKMPTVIDADGLNLLAKYSDFSCPETLIITPHPMEAARLLGADIDDVLKNLEYSAKKLSAKYNCVTVLKTHRTIICEGEKVFINENGNSALAKAGTGDVLAGIITGLLAQKMSPFESAKLGVYLHSRAGEIASEELTEYSVLASDVIKYLHKAIKEIL